MAFRKISTFGSLWLGFGHVRRFSVSNASLTFRSLLRSRRVAAFLRSMATVLRLQALQAHRRHLRFGPWKPGARTWGTLSSPSSEPRLSLSRESSFDGELHSEPWFSLHFSKEDSPFISLTSHSISFSFLASFISEYWRWSFGGAQNSDLTLERSEDGGCRGEKNVLEGILGDW